MSGRPRGRPRRRPCDCDNLGDHGAAIAQIVGVTSRPMSARGRNTLRARNRRDVCHRAPRLPRGIRRHQIDFQAERRESARRCRSDRAHLRVKSHVKRRCRQAAGEASLRSLENTIQSNVSRCRPRRRGRRPPERRCERASSVASAPNDSRRSTNSAALIARARHQHALAEGGRASTPGAPGGDDAPPQMAARRSPGGAFVARAISSSVPTVVSCRSVP